MIFRDLGWHAADFYIKKEWILALYRALGRGRGDFRLIFGRARTFSSSFYPSGIVGISRHTTHKVERAVGTSLSTLSGQKAPLTPKY